MRKSFKGFGVRGGGLAEGRGGCSARNTAAQSSRTPAQPIALRTNQLEPSPINACCAESSRLVDANLGRQRQSWEGQKGFRRVRTAAKDRATRGGAPVRPSPKQLSDLWNQFASPFLSAAKFAQKLSGSIKSSSGKPSGRRAVRGPEWGSEADPQCSSRWVNAISPPASHGSARMCWNASGVPAQMPVKSMWKLRCCARDGMGTGQRKRGREDGPKILARGLPPAGTARPFYPSAKSLTT